MDTIAAIATAPGRGGVAIVRISGSRAGSVAQQLLGFLPPPRQAVLADFGSFSNPAGSAGTTDNPESDFNISDRGIALWFPAPASFTGEDVLELHGHGSPVLMTALLKHIYSLDVRPAEPGEFSQRAFLNDKIDLYQAEALAELINSNTLDAAKAAARALSGETSSLLQQLMDKVTDIRAQLEAQLDFPDDLTDEESTVNLLGRLEKIHSELRLLLERMASTEKLNSGFSIAIIGPPNAGKSTLLNALSSTDTAIVSEEPGTTRDLLREQIVLAGLNFEMVDTAGLRDTDNKVEQEGIRRAVQTAERADLLIAIYDSSNERAETIQQLLLRTADLSEKKYLLVANKCDISGLSAGQHKDFIAVSASHGDGLKALQMALIAAASAENSNESNTILTRTRHREAAQKAQQALEKSMTCLKHRQTPELAAEDLREVNEQLGKIIGKVCNEELLNRIFSEFCIGK